MLLNQPFIVEQTISDTVCESVVWIHVYSVHYVDAQEMETTSQVKQVSREGPDITGWAEVIWRGRI